jgi:DNA recombination protein RmuC
MAFYILLSFIVGLIVGFICCYLLFSREKRELVSQNEKSQSLLMEKEFEISNCKNEITKLETTLEIERKNFAEQETLLKRTEEKFRETFSALAYDVLNKNSESFVKLALESLKSIEADTKGVLGEKGSEITSKIAELEKSLKSFDSAVREIELKRESAYTKIEGSYGKLDKTTTDLLNALRSAKGSGNWGEVQLQRIVELAGMQNHTDFTLQEQKEGERPDLIVYLPQGRKIIVDAKAPISSFLKSLDENSKSKEELLNEFVSNVKKRVTELSRKEYFKTFEGSIDFVVMFIPSEAMFSTMIEKDSAFIEDCIRQRVVPASPLTLISLLKAISYGWTQVELEIEAKEILEKAKAIYENLCNSSGHLQELGKSLHKAIESYNSFVGSVERNVFSKGRELFKLNPSKEIAETKEVSEIPRELKSPDWKREDRSE